MKIFKLNRKQDVTGVSGTGIVAEGVIFKSGKVCLCWNGDISSIVIYDTIECVKKIHCHNGSTFIEYDEPSIKITKHKESSI